MTSRSSNPHVVLFDFDGTLADSLAQARLILQELARRHGFRCPSHEQMSAARGMSALQWMRELNIPARKLPLILAQGRGELGRKLDAVNPFDGMLPVLAELRNCGCRVGIVTSNSRANVERFLQRHPLGVWDYLGAGLQLMGKARELRQALRALGGIDPGCAAYVGDETRDIEAARRAGLRSIAVTWGYNSRELLAANSPDDLVETPQELTTALSAWRLNTAAPTGIKNAGKLGVTT